MCRNQLADTRISTRTRECVTRIYCFCLAEADRERTEHREAKERRRVKDFLLGKELGFGRPRWACRTRRPRAWESSAMSVHSVMRTLRKNKTLRYGVPMLLLIVGGSFGLREFSQIRYDAVKIKKIKDSAFDDWKNIRGPRPWEDPDLLQGRNPEILKTKTT
ncbi:cytochrome c oxidase assembly protein COX16 homolog, mitochondrial isoform X2 [Meles meles]|uniref:cytochrome c oxidase assembly protein COX16 homolog, mitochondrial isoform X2 n=1 Tax=Meles meles TaxID=9662 RepID=UPI001E6994D7|nr:cytochrome c oxidase assembly protein COX16 homolog, mitochondrial isoform X2 [Meles meles]